MWVLPIISILAGFFSLTELGRPDANSLWAVAVALFFMLAGASTVEMLSPRQSKPK